MVFQTTHKRKMGVLDPKSMRNEETVISKGLRPIVSVGRILGVISSIDLFSNTSDGNSSKPKRYGMT